jgi:hypothetical protein
MVATGHGQSWSLTFKYSRTGKWVFPWNVQRTGIEFDYYLGHGNSRKKSVTALDIERV